jgi:hypothetical protein
MSLLLVACVPSGATPDGEATQQAVFTAAAQTLFAQLTQSAGETAVAQLTQIAQQPSATPPPPTSPPPTPTSPPATITPIPGRCDWAEYVQSVSVEDNSVFYPGGVFTKIWRVRNIGTCEWSPAYTLSFAGGDPMGAPLAIPLPGVVRPGELVDLAVTMTAPASPGVYQGNWLLRNPSGTLFGTGPDALGALQVQIQVTQPPAQGRGNYDFALRYCDALWRSDSAALGCPGFVDDPNGSVVLLSQPYLESRLEDEQTLWTRPNAAVGGRILGQYPDYVVRSGDRFRTEVGCLRDSPGCDVTFSLDYRRADGTSFNLGTWREVYDGRTTTIDIDLTALAGQAVQFLLGVRNNGQPGAANAFWFVPRVETVAPQSNLVMVWSQQGGSQNVCEELRISLTGVTDGFAQARSCEGAGQDLGSSSLTATELDQLLAWVAQLAPFDAELFNADQSGPLISYMTFNGRGSSDAQNQDITAMQNYAEALYGRITR